MLRNRPWQMVKTFEGEGAGGGGGAGDAGGGQAGGDGGQQQQQQQQQTPAPYYPDALPETLRGATDRETLDKIAADFAGRPKAPETAEAYQFAPSDAFKERYGDAKDDAVLGMWRGIAHKHRLTNETFNGVVADLYDGMAKAGMIDDPVNLDAELKKLETGDGDAVARRSAAEARVQVVVDKVKGLHNRKDLSDGEAAALTSIAKTADGVMAIEKLFKAAEKGGLQVGGQGGQKQPKSAIEMMFPTHFQ